MQLLRLAVDDLCFISSQTNDGSADRTINTLVEKLKYPNKQYHLTCDDLRCLKLYITSL